MLQKKKVIYLDRVMWGIYVQGKKKENARSKKRERRAETKKKRTRWDGMRAEGRNSAASIGEKKGILIAMAQTRVKGISPAELNFCETTRAKKVGVVCGGGHAMVGLRMSSVLFVHLGVAVDAVFLVALTVAVALHG